MQGAGSLTDGRTRVAEEEIMIVRHGLTTWNEQRRIQARRGVCIWGFTPPPHSVHSLCCDQALERVNC